LAVALATAAMTLVPALVLFLAWRRGAFRDFAAQSRVIFEPRDWRVARPWESPTDRLTREVAWGDPLPADAGEWGGSDTGRPDEAPVYGDAPVTYRVADVRPPHTRATDASGGDR
jgi:hypothetical protein